MESSTCKNRLIVILEAFTLMIVLQAVTELAEWFFTFFSEYTIL